MRIIIVGAGEIGFQLAKMLSEENHDVTLLDKDSEKCQRAREHLDVLVFEGNGGSAHTLSEAGIKKMDMMIAVTSTDEVNIMACMFANRLGVETKVARVRNAEYSKPRALITPSQLGIDKMIHPEEEAAKQIKNLIRRSAASEVAEFSGGRIQLVGIKLREGSPIIGKSLQTIALDHPGIQYRTVAISRDGETLMPSGTDIFNLKDHVYIIAKS
ncbi:MAG: NAD-binding protein, partial [Candidatus Marinimicrobia bacterium]|nr:NAD-binding protein [Candidatus Neomarinimicrobiota bacterium]